LVTHIVYPIFQVADQQAVLYTHAVETVELFVVSKVPTAARKAEQWQAAVAALDI
jgi:hypothetical protein